MLYERKNVKLVAYFGYEQALIRANKFEGDEGTWVSGTEFPSCLAGEFRQELFAQAREIACDNKETYIFADRGGPHPTFYAIMFYDGTATMISWGHMWGDKVPGNFTDAHQREKVAKAVQDYIRPLLERHGASCGWRRGPQRIQPGMQSVAMVETCDFRVTG